MKDIDIPQLKQAARYRSVRQRSERLAAPLTPEDCQAQSMPEASPVKWHLAHTTWFFETFVLERFEPGFRPFDPSYRRLFNSYYDTVGDRHPRPLRGLLTRPTLDQVMAWRADVDARIERLLDRAPEEVLRLVVLGCQHEQQHQELILTDLKHLLSSSELFTAYGSLPPEQPCDDAGAAAVDWLAVAGGRYEIGHSGSGFAFDNETPRHSVWLQPFELADRLVTHREWGEFVADGGYRDPRWWLSDGWAWRVSSDVRTPLYWQGERSDAPIFTLAGLRAPQPDAPIVHVSYYEADAYARWRSAADPAGGPVRLPTEAEWEVAVCLHRPSPAPAPDDETAIVLHPAPVTGRGLRQLEDAVWQWTRSGYEAYPGYRPAAGAMGEYNGKFMVNQYVLRGGSFATPPSHRRLTYRNFFPASARWQFTGVRLARDG